MTNYIQFLDLRFFLALNRLTHSWQLSSIARAISKTGDGWLYLLIMPLSIELLQPQNSRVLVLQALGGFAMERSAYFILKNILKRPRPPEAIKDYKSYIQASDRFSLPSGHTSAAFFVATFLSFGLSLTFLPMYGWALSVGLSRILLGVHFPSDILAGACLGFAVSFIIL